MQQIFWGYWDDYEKEIYQGQEFAKVGSRLYTRHAVDRFLPSGMRLTVTQDPGKNIIKKSWFAGDPASQGRSVPPSLVEEVILHGKQEPYVKNLEITNYLYGDLIVGTKEKARIIITIIYTRA